MAVSEVNYFESGGGTKAVEGTFQLSSGDLTVTVDGITNIDTVCWRLENVSNNYGYAKKYGSPYNDMVKMAYNGSSLYASTYAVQSISGNQFTFHWGSSNMQTFDYVAYGE